LSQIRYRTKTLVGLLGEVLALEFRPEHVDFYREARRKEVSLTAVCRELEILDTAFREAVKRRVLRLAPFIEKPTEDRVREKEIPLEAFPKILEEMAKRDPVSRDYAEWLLLTAMRPKGVRALRWDWLDMRRVVLENGELRPWTLKVPAEKRGNARVFSIEGSLRRVIERRLPDRFKGPTIFPVSERHGRRVFYAALEACGHVAGRKGYTLYDSKKTAAGLLIDSGLSESEAMNFSGHATPSTFNRYLIKSAKRHGAAVRKRDEYLEKRLADIRGVDADSVAEFPRKS